MSSRSVSEGEITEVKIEKATTTLPTNNKSSVNRKLRDALSPSPEAEASRTSASSTASNDRLRYRSRSPYREDRPFRGEKRGRGQDSSRNNARSDPRRFKVHYEGRSDVDRDYRGPGHQNSNRSAIREDRSAYKDPARHDDRAQRFGYNERTRDDNREDRDANRAKRRRTASYSPERHDKRDDDSERYSKNLSTESRPGVGQSSRGKNDRYDRNGNLKAHFIPQNIVNGRTTNGAQVAKSTAAHQKGVSNVVTFSLPANDKSAADTNTISGAGQAVELSAEERRRRREAIKAKYNATSAPPLPIQNLQRASTPITPASPTDTLDSTPSRQASPAPYSPGFSQLEGAAASPPHIHVSHDAELANRPNVHQTANNADERSAFDYDPTMDMEEDRFKGDKFYNIAEVSATSYDENKVDEDRKILIPESIMETTETIVENPKKLAGDMFASDDEDDMFAPAAETKKPSSVGPFNRAVAVSKAKTLDQSLLDNWDDKDGYYRVILGELLEERYHVLTNLGKGVFSGVVRATDTVTQGLVAIKIIRNQEAMVKAGMKEIEILERLANADPEDKKHLIRLERSFTHKGHLCMVFENLSLDLRGVLQKFGRDVGINLRAVRSYAQQIFLGLSLLQKCNILHADLKPDNILVNEARNMLKICDLGSAADAADGSEITPYLVSRFYRAPEIMLGMKYDFALDMWSIGCTLYELYTGKILFTGRNNNQMLRSIMECRGKFSLKMLKKGEFSGDHFDDQNLNFISREIDKISGREVVKLINIVKPIRDLKSRLLAAAGATSGARSLPDSELKELNLFADLLDRCLALNPERRITSAEALKHPFVYRPALAFGPGK